MFEENSSETGEYRRILHCIIDFFDCEQLPLVEMICYRHIKALGLFFEEDKKATEQMVQLYDESLKQKELWGNSLLSLHLAYLVVFYQKNRSDALRAIIL